MSGDLLYGNFDLHREGSRVSFTIEELQARKQWIGASEMAAAIGVCPYRSRFELWQDKVLPEIRSIDNPAMLWGRRNEAHIIADYCENNLCEIIETQARRKIWETPPARATLDAIIRTESGETMALEAKCTTSRNLELGDDGTDQIPQSWLVQAQCQMKAAGLDRCAFAVLVDGNTSREYMVERNDAIIASIYARAAEFWEHVASRTTPPPEWCNPAELTKRFRWLEDMGEPVDFRGTDAERLWLEYEDLGRAISAKEKERERLKAEVIVAMGDHRNAILSGDRELVIVETNRKGYVVKPTSYHSIKARKIK